MSLFNDKVAKLLAGHEALLMRKNEPVEEGNGVITRYRYPVLTAACLLYTSDAADEL